ncbi:TPA: hypothetical protein HA363_07345 [Candidatus Woesearchaeota archaeon]|nr:hypothetical protein [Candidatus Woesearchaeota archaeon]
MEDFLRDVDQDKVFFFRNRAAARNLYELSQQINALDEDSFKFHCNLDHDDFANWIGGAVNDIELSQKLRYIKDKNKYLKIISDRIKKLEHKSRASQLNKQFAESVRNLVKDYGHVLLLIFVILMTCIFTAMIYFQYHSLVNIKTLDEKINYLESRNTCFNNYFNEQIIRTKDLLGNVSFNLDNYCVYNVSTSASIPDSVLENIPENIPIERIRYNNNQVILNINDSSLSIFEETSSMLPVINHHSKAIEIKPDKLSIGDIISYKDNEVIVVHRIVDIGADSEGTYYITKGDNNNAVDQKKVRFNDVQGKIVAIIY